jgi:hypothetical protein
MMGANFHFFLSCGPLVLCIDEPLYLEVVSVVSQLMIGTDLMLEHSGLRKQMVPGKVRYGRSEF